MSLRCQLLIPQSRPVIRRLRVPQIRLARQRKQQLRIRYRRSVPHKHAKMALELKLRIHQPLRLLPNNKLPPPVLLLSFFHWRLFRFEPLTTIAVEIGAATQHRADCSTECMSNFNGADFAGPTADEKR